MPSSPNYKRDYKQEAATESDARRKARAQRNKARRQLEKEGKVHKFDNRQVDHIKPLGMGGSNKRSNLRVRSQAANSSYRRTSSGKMKYRDQS
jgi:hypothetical protein